MPKHLLATAAILFALAVPADAQEQPTAASPTEEEATGSTGAADARTPTTQVQNEQTNTPAEEVAPDPAGAGNPTGGVTAPAREMLPEDSSETPVGPEAAESGQSPEMGAQPSGGQAGVVGAEMLEELRRMAIELERKTTKPAPPKTEAQKQAEQKAIAAHRESFFARVEERG